MSNERMPLQSHSNAFLLNLFSLSAIGHKEHNTNNQKNVEYQTPIVDRSIPNFYPQYDYICNKMCFLMYIERALLLILLIYPCY